MLPLFYTDVAGVERVRDRDRKVAFGANRFSFCAASHLCPCLASEFSSGAREYPIVFVMENGVPTPVFLFGLRPGQNLMVSETGAWRGGYMPRYLARFPFIIAEVPASQSAPQLILGLDASAAHDETGEALFDESGEPSAFLTQMLKVSDAYALDAKASEAFAARLQQLELFRTINVEINDNGQTYGWSDLLAVDEAKLNGLPDEDLLALARNGYLAAIHSHLLSLQSFRSLREIEARDAVAPALA